MENTELISVIIPAYNVGKYVGRSIESVLQQRYPCMEVVVVDDGSTDDTAAVIDSYAQRDSRVHAVHQSNGGVTSARLHGVREAKGQWIGFVDADDTIEPDMYARLLQNAKKYHAQISHCGYQMVFEDGRVNYFHNTERVMEQDTSKALIDLLCGDIVEPGLWNKLYQKNLLERLVQDNPIPIDIKINEDLLMNFYLFSYAQHMVFEDWCPYHYTVRQGSASRQKLNYHKIYDPIRVKEEILKISGEDVMPSAKRAYLQTCISVYNSITLSDQNDLKESLRNVRETLKNHAEWRDCLGRKQRLLLWMILHTPRIYRPIYSVYSNHFMQNPYE